jgi:hypothetical protein
MKMVEQNISGVKLERLRQNAVKKHKILRKLFPVCLILFIGLTLVKNRFLFASISEYGWGDPATQGAHKKSSNCSKVICVVCGNAFSKIAPS